MGMDVRPVAACVAAYVAAAAWGARAASLRLEGRGKSRERDDGEEKTGEPHALSPQLQDAVDATAVVSVRARV